MDVEEKLRNFAKEFDLDYNKGNYKYLVCSRREIIIRNFLGLCPMQNYSKYHKNNPENIETITEFLGSTEYDKELQRPQGCVLYDKSISWEKRSIEKVNDKCLVNEVQDFYNRLEDAIEESRRLTIVSDSDGEMFKEILLHEFIHELSEGNLGRPESWEWNEGLIYYLENFTLGRLDLFDREPRNVNYDKEWYEGYFLKGREWRKLLENVNSPQERRKIIENKIAKLNK